MSIRSLSPDRIVTAPAALIWNWIGVARSANPPRAFVSTSQYVPFASPSVWKSPVPVG